MSSSLISAVLPAQLLPAGQVEYEKTRKHVATRTRGRTWDIMEEAATSGEFVPVHVFGRHEGEYHIKRADLDGRRQEVFLWRRRCAE